MLSLGAINKNTGNYVYPKIANKKDDYICTECNKEVILCQGEVRVPYFRHKVDVNPCHHYTSPTESQIHKDAKMLLKTILEGKTPIQFERECTSCKNAIDIILPEIEQESIISLEHRFSYNGSTKIADVAHLLNGEVKSIFELMHTHKTSIENRPEPWLEINASWLLNYVNTNEDPLKLKCIRGDKCVECGAPIADQPENAELEDEDTGAMVLEEFIDLKALRIIRDNFPEVFRRMGGIWVQDTQDFEYKEADEKTAFTLINDYYHQKVKTSKVSYRFLARLKVGRRFSKGISLQGISRKIRHTIAKNLYYDVDMKNAHPTFCLDLAKKLEFHHPILELYNTHRDDCLARWIGVEVVGNDGLKYRLKTKDDVKEYFLKMLNGGGNSKSSSDELNNFYKTHQTFLDLIYKHKDFASFRKRADNKYADKQKRDKPANDKKMWDNRKGTVLNYYLCKVENDALTQMEVFLQARNIKYGALCFDGIMIYKDGVEDLHDLLKQMEIHLHETMKFPIVLAVKEMNEDIDISDLEEKKDILTSDEDYALYLLEALEGEFMYDYTDKKIWFWDNGVRLWREQKPRHLRTLITKILLPYVESSPDPEVVETESFFLKTDAKQSALVRMCEPYIEKRRDDTFIRENFDRKKGFLPITDNKIIDLSNGTIRTRVKEDYFTKTTENKLVHVPEDIRVEIFQYYTSLLTTKDGVLPSVEHRDCLIMVFAYAMTGLNHLKAFINLVGEKDGGKSLCITLHNLIMGEFGGSANERLFVAQKNKSCHDSEMFNLLGRRMTTLTETSKNQQFNEDLIKKISGGDEVNIRGASEKKTLDVVFDTIMFLATNNMCQFSDPAFMSRLRCFNFVNYFKKDDAVRDRLLSLRHHFFTIMVEYCVKFYENGRQITWSKEVLDYTEKVCDEQDTIKVWLREQGDFEKGTADDYVRKDFFEAYQDYWRGSGRKAEGKITFYRKFEEIFGLSEAKKMKKTIHGLQETFWGYSHIKRREDDL
jgi:hypothetical protein